MCPLQIDPKPAAASGRGFDTDVATHAFNAFADDGQADASAGVPRAVQPFEDTEHTLRLIVGNANAVVFEP